jgi:hypothetical protein
MALRNLELNSEVVLPPAISVQFTDCLGIFPSESVVARAHAQISMLSMLRWRRLATQLYASVIS